MLLRKSSWTRLLTRLGFILEKKPRHGRRTDIALAIRQYEERRLLTGNVVSLLANDPTATENLSTDKGQFTVSRTGDLTSALTVTYTIGGTATNGMQGMPMMGDYQYLSGSVTIGAGQSSALIDITPNDNAMQGGDKTVILTAQSSANYTLGSNTSGTVTIWDDETPAAITVTAPDASASETSPDTGTFHLSRSRLTSTALVVNYMMSGTATNGTAGQPATGDYLNLPGTVTFGAGATSVDITLTPVDDAIVEGTETATLMVMSGSGFTGGNPSSATISIADNDVLPTVTLSATTASASETGPTAGVFTVTRTGSTAASLTVNYTTSGTATNASDYQSLSGTVTIAAGQSSATINVLPIDDAIVESDETVVLNLMPMSGYTVGAPSSGTVTIADNDNLPTVTITANDSSASETGPDQGQFTVTRTGSVASALVVNYALSGTATNGTSGQPTTGDYQYLSGTVTIAAGQSSAVINVVPVDDTLVESTETVIATVSAAAGYTVGGSNSATVNITDNDVLPTVTITASTPNASETGPTTGVFTISRTGPTTSSLTVNYALSGTATNGTSGQPTTGDYQYLSGTVTIAAGAANATVTVTPVDDALIEPMEMVMLNLASSPANYTLGTTTSATVNITDNDVPPTVTITATDANASEEGLDPGVFTFTRTGPTTSALTVNYMTTGTATSASDYQALTGSVTIAAGQSSATVTVTPIDDEIIESTETVMLTIGTAPDVTENGGTHAAYTVGTPSTATVNIADNDVLPTLTVEIPDSSAAEEGQDPGTFLVRRTGPTTQALMIHYQIGGTATNAPSGSTDLTYLSGVVTIAAGAATAALTVTPVDDQLVEPTETVILTLMSDSAYLLGATTSGQVNITDNDVLPEISIAATTASASETGPTPGAFTFTRTGPTTSDLMVQYTIGGSATISSDYTGPSVAGSTGTVIISAGHATAVVQVTPIDDSIYEGSETVVLTLQSQPASYTLSATATAATVTIADNDPPPAPEIDVQDGQTSLVDDGSTVDLGDTSVGTPVMHSFTIRNTGTATLNLGSTVSLPSGFTLMSAPSTSVIAGSSTTFGVQLTATAAGSYSGQVSISSDDADENPFTFTLSAVVHALPPQISVVDSWYQQITDDLGTVAFGDTPQGTSVSKTLTIYNWGTGQLSIDPQSVTLPTGFALVGDMPTTIAAGGGHANFTLRLTGTAPGSYNGTFSFDNNDPNHGTYNFSLTGHVTAEQPSMEVRQSTGALVAGGGDIDFGNVVVGQTVSRSFVIYNWGTAGLSLNTSSVQLPAGFTLTTPFASQINPLGGQTTFTIRMDSAAAGSFSGTVSIESNDSAHSPFAFTVHGTADVVAVWDLQLERDTGSAVTDRVTSDPTLRGNVIGDFGGGSVRVEFDHDGDGTVDGSVDVTTTGAAFEYDPRVAQPALATYRGEIPLRYRPVLLDSDGNVVSTGVWGNFTIALADDPPVAAAVIADFRLAHDTGTSHTDHGVSPP